MPPIGTIRMCREDRPEKNNSIITGVLADIAIFEGDGVDALAFAERAYEIAEKLE